MHSAIQYAIEGSYWKAAKALLSSDVPTNSQFVRKSLLSNHPQYALPCAPHDPTAYTAFTSFTETDVQASVSTFPAAAAAWASGLSATHSKELLKIPTTDGGLKGSS